MSAPDAPAELRAAHGAVGAAALRFVILLRDPISRATSSVRMMREWGWEAANRSAALARDAAALRVCAAAAVETEAGETSAAGPEAAALAALAAALPTLSDAALRRLRGCLARGAPLNHVRAGAYAAGAVAWRHHFAPSQFMWLETEAMRAASPPQLLRLLAAFLRLPTHHLAALPRPLRAACENPRATADDRAAVHSYPRLPPLLAARLSAAFRPLNALLARLLPDAEQLRGAAWLHQASLT